MICGKLLRHWRLTHGYTARDLAKMVGVSSTSIHDWESGKRQPSPEKEAKLRGFMYPGKKNGERRTDHAAQEEKSHAGTDRGQT